MMISIKPSMMPMVEPMPLDRLFDTAEKAVVYPVREKCHIADNACYGKKKSVASYSFICCFYTLIHNAVNIPYIPSAFQAQ